MGSTDSVGQDPTLSGHQMSTRVRAAINRFAESEP